MNIVGMTKEELINLDPRAIERPLTGEEVLYIAKTLGAHWEYNYGAVERGKPGLHAELKSGWHSDGFFVSRILLAPPNILELMARQIAGRFSVLRAWDRNVPKPDWVAGIPDGATELGKSVASILGAKNAEMRKENGRIVMLSDIPAGETLLLVEDFCTKGTGFREALWSTISRRPETKIILQELVIVNRSGLSEFVIKETAETEFDLVVKIAALADHRVNDWPAYDCLLCKLGSKPIKPNATDENWRSITTSQQ